MPINNLIIQALDGINPKHQEGCCTHCAIEAANLLAYGIKYKVTPVPPATLEDTHQQKLIQQAQSQIETGETSSMDADCFYSFLKKTSKENVIYIVDIEDHVFNVMTIDKKIYLIDSDKHIYKEILTIKDFINDVSISGNNIKLNYLKSGTDTLSVKKFGIPNNDILALFTIYSDPALVEELRKKLSNTLETMRKTAIESDSIGPSPKKYNAILARIQNAGTIHDLKLYLLGGEGFHSSGRKIHVKPLKKEVDECFSGYNGTSSFVDYLDICPKWDAVQKEVLSVIEKISSQKVEKEQKYNPNGARAGSSSTFSIFSIPITNTDNCKENDPTSQVQAEIKVENKS